MLIENKLKKRERLKKKAEQIRKKKGRLTLSDKVKLIAEYLGLNFPQD